MFYDFYSEASNGRRTRIITAQQILYGRILRSIRFSSALEIGPGYGGFAEYCRVRKVSYLGVEPNPILAQALQDRGFEVKIGLADSIDADSRKFDLLMLSHVIEHLGVYPEVARILGLLLARLHPDGTLVLLFPDLAWSPRSYAGDYSHIFPTTLRAIRKLCLDLGWPCVRGGHYVGRWLLGWRALWLFHRLLPTWVLPEWVADALGDRFAAHGYCIARRGTSGRPGDQEIPLNWPAWTPRLSAKTAFDAPRP